MLPELIIVVFEMLISLNIPSSLMWIDIHIQSVEEKHKYTQMMDFVMRKHTNSSMLLPSFLNLSNSCFMPVGTNFSGINNLQFYFKMQISDSLWDFVKPTEGGAQNSGFNKKHPY